MQRNTPPDAGEQPRNVEARERASGYGLVPAPNAPRVEGSHPSQVAMHRSARRHARHGTPWFAWMLGGCLGLVVVVVLFCAVLIGTLGGLAFRFASTQSASETKSMNWSVSGAPAIRVESDAADIHVRTGVDGQVHLAVALSAHAASESERARCVAEDHGLHGADWQFGRNRRADVAGGQPWRFARDVAHRDGATTDERGGRVAVGQCGGGWSERQYLDQCS